MRPFLALWAALLVYVLSMPGWYLAAALVKLRAQINAIWPQRDRTSDGSIGDQAHRRRKSDHNPNSRGSVNAIDIDKDGIDPGAVMAALRKDPRVNYYIFAGYIYSRAFGFAKRTYTGANKHFSHIHVSILQSASAENDSRNWALGPAQAPTAPAMPPAPVTEPVPDRAWPGNPSAKFGGYNREEFAGHFDGNVQWIQRKANRTNLDMRVVLGNPNEQPKLADDGRYGPKTETAIRSLQGAFGFSPRWRDGIVGPMTWAKLNERA